jgi:hypothetical protein
MLARCFRLCFRLGCLGIYTYRSVLPRRSRVSAFLAVFACLSALVLPQACVFDGVIGAEFFLWCLKVPEVSEPWQAMCVVVSILFTGFQCPWNVEYILVAMACGTTLTFLRRFLVYRGVIDELEEEEKRKKDD